MIDEKIKELINRVLDGELSAEEQQKLEAYLQTDKEARDYFEKMQKMNDWLNQVQPVEVPSSLKTNIMRQLDARRYAPKIRGTKPQAISTLRQWLKGITVRPALAFAFGVVLSGLLFLIILWQTTDFQRMEHWPLTGTMKVERQTIPVALTGVNGKLEITSRKEQSTISVDLNPQEEVILTIKYDPKTLTLKIIAPVENGIYELRQELGKIVIRSRQRLAIDFNFQLLKSSAKLSTSLEVGGRVIFRKKIIF